MIRGQRELEARICAMTAELVERLGMGWITVTCRFNEQETGDLTQLCETTGRWNYREGFLDWDVHRAASQPDEDLRAAIVHELAHLLIGPLFDELSDKQKLAMEKYNEYATENFARAILAVMDGK